MQYRFVVNFGTLSSYIWLLRYNENKSSWQLFYKIQPCAAEKIFCLARNEFCKIDRAGLGKWGEIVIVIPGLCIFCSKINMSKCKREEKANGA